MKDTSTQPAAPERLWNTKDVAAYFNVSKWQVLDYVENHGLPCKRLSPRVWRFVPSEVLAWAEARRTSTPERQQ